MISQNLHFEFHRSPLRLFQTFGTFEVDADPVVHGLDVGLFAALDVEQLEDEVRQPPDPFLAVLILFLADEGEDLLGLSEAEQITEVVALGSVHLTGPLLQDLLGAARELFPVDDDRQLVEQGEGLERVRGYLEIF